MCADWLAYGPNGSKYLYIHLQDCPKSYNRLTPEQPVGLKYTHCSLKLEEMVRDPGTGRVEELRVSWQPLQDKLKPSSGTPHPKAFVHWVSSPLSCTMRFYQEL